jgi:hypothetical protein
MQPLVARESAAPPQSAVRRAWLVAAAAVVAAVVVAAVAAGWDVVAWLSAVWDSLTSISPAYLVAALALQTLQTVFAAAAWHGILRYAYPESEVRYRGVLACYATGAALNVASLHEATSAANASAYSVGHQLLSTVWNIALAAVLVAVAFGRSGGKQLVGESSARARELRPQGDDAVHRAGASSDRIALTITDGSSRSRSHWTCAAGHASPDITLGPSGHGWSSRG